MGRNGFVGILNQNYEYFLKICDTGNITRAAQAIGISQPSLSHAMQRLEQEEQATLLVRTSKGIQPTAAGQRLELRLRLALSAAESGTVDAPGSQVLVGCNQSLLPILYGALAAPKSIGPFHELRLVHELSRDCAEGVYHGRLDLAIVAGEVQYPDLIRRPLREDALYLWKSSSRPAQKSTLLVNPGTQRLPQILRSLKRDGLDFSHRISSSDYLCLASLTAQGFGYGLLPEIALARPVHGERLEKVMETPLALTKVSLIYRRESAAFLRDFIERIAYASQSLESGHA